MDLFQGIGTHRAAWSARFWCSRPSSPAFVLYQSPVTYYGRADNVLVPTGQMTAVSINRMQDTARDTHSHGLLQWFAIHVKSNFEQPVSRLLSAKGVEEFLPTYRSRRLWSDRVRYLDLPLFPGYVFCRIPKEKHPLVLATTGVVSLVGVQGHPVPIDDREITAIRKMVESRSGAEPWPLLRIGQRVRVRKGPLCGVEGFLLRVKDSCRLVISLTLLGRSVATEIDAAFVSPI